MKIIFMTNDVDGEQFVQIYVGMPKILFFAL